uniref:Leukocyte receptor cluster member 4 n=1 Tax=Sarcophilus harrisii TaxID=9305 RepID=A0A7N4P0T5_SARHA
MGEGSRGEGQGRGRASSPTASHSPPGPGLKQWGAAGVGVALTLLTCGPHILHSLVTVLGTWIIMETWPRSCHALALAWTFLYLLFFRMVTVLGLPAPTPFTNAVQLLLTLKLVSLASEVQELRAQKEMEPQKRPTVGQLLAVPSLPQILSYSYCYVGLLTGPFYRYRTYHDWVHQGPAPVPSWEPLLLRARPAPLFGLLFLLSSWLFPLEAVREDSFYDRPFAFRLFTSPIFPPSGSSWPGCGHVTPAPGWAYPGKINGGPPPYPPQHYIHPWVAGQGTPPRPPDAPLAVVGGTTQAIL